MYSPEQQRIVDEQTATIRSSLNLPENRTLWTYEQRFNFNKQLASFILANPAVFTSVPAVTDVARDVQQKDYIGLENTDITFTAFLDEFDKQVSAVNPLSEENRNKTYWTIAGLAAVAIAVYFGVAALKNAPSK